LEEKGNRTGRPYEEMILSGADLSWDESEFLRTDDISFYPGPRNLCQRINRHEMLMSEARILSLCSDVVKGQGPLKDHRKGQGGSQNLASPFAERTVNFYHATRIMLHILKLIERKYPVNVDEALV
jgi:hypothetical protein